MVFVGDIYSKNLSYDNKKIDKTDLVDRCETGRINNLQLELAKMKEISYVYYPTQGDSKIPVDPLKFLLSYRSFFREIYCGFGCPSRDRCDIRASFGVNEAFSLEYVLDNFPVNPTEGTLLDDTPESRLKNAIELYISSRKQHISEHEWIWGKFSNDEREELLKIQRDILEHYTPVLEKGVEKLVLESNYELA